MEIPLHSAHNAMGETGAATKEGNDVSLDWVGHYYARERCEAIYARKTAAVKGSINVLEAHFLQQRILARRPACVVEIGTCAGVSTAVIADALMLINRVDGGERRVLSYDLLDRYFFDKSLEVGFFLKEMPEALNGCITLRTGCTALDVGADVARDSLEFVFIDASHQHPWPCLDLWAVLPYVRDDAELCFHDVNLPLANPKYPSYGVKYLFDTLILDKRYAEPIAGRVSNMGSVLLAGNKGQVREQIIRAIETYPWECSVERAWLEKAGIWERVGACWEANEGQLTVDS